MIRQACQCDASFPHRPYQRPVGMTFEFWHPEIFTASVACACRCHASEARKDPSSSGSWKPVGRLVSLVSGTYGRNYSAPYRAYWASHLCLDRPDDTTMCNATRATVPEA